MTEVKICGLTRVEDALLAMEEGAWALGMIMSKQSPRYCTPAQAFEIAAATRRKSELAGVFVDAALDEVAGLADEIGFTLIQLHGSEGPQYCDEIARRTGCRVIKAMRIQDRATVQELRQFRDVDFQLVDTFKSGVPGGTGETFDWSLLARREDDLPLLLSGGLTTANVAEAIATVGPWAVDVASGVEASPGVKDPDRLRAFVAAVRGADRVAA